MRGASAAVRLIRNQSEYIGKEASKALYRDLPLRVLSFGAVCATRMDLRMWFRPCCVANASQRLSKLEGARLFDLVASYPVIPDHGQTVFHLERPFVYWFSVHRSIAVSTPLNCAWVVVLPHPTSCHIASKTLSGHSLPRKLLNGQPKVCFHV